MARKLASVGIETPDDLLAYLPRDYKDRRTPQPIATLEEGEAVVVGRALRVRERQGRYPLVTVDVHDESGTIAAKWFGRRHLFGAFAAGDRLVVTGRVARSGPRLEINVATHRVMREGEPYVGEVTPIYPATKDLSSRTIRSLVAKNLDRLIGARPDRLPTSLAQKLDFPDTRTAWHDVHVPDSPEAAARARKRILFEDFFAIALAAALRRARREAESGAPVMRAPGDLLERFTATLSFPLTGAQRRVIAEIWRDMGRTHAMNRLLQGDVGSGKTLVAAAAILLAAHNGYQSALMAPTEILAAQHAQKLAPLLLPFGITVEAVFGSLGAAARRGANNRIRNGEASLAVGTHALLTESVDFARLGLVIVDEQHRFGVEQRRRLREKSVAPHTLAMTATPIPRTLAQTQFADLDLSTIDEMPPDRTPIETYVVRESRKDHVYEFVRANVALGRQAYVVAPAIDESEGALTGALAEAEAVKAGPLRDLAVAVLHGRMPQREKDEIMGRFTRGDIDVLVATTVVEVGVDVPNASVMVVLDANRYGLAQLHQLRGRVGRGIERSFCILVSPDDAGEVERLEILARTNDGFAIAEEDLRLRSRFELAGTIQAGVGNGVSGEIVRDFALYMTAKAEADRIVAEDPELLAPQHATLEALVNAQASARAMLVTS